jgi:5-methylcytosine-specific restriction endonuclease McrA
MDKEVLTLDRNWEPHRWISKQDAIVHEATGEVLQHLGESIFVFHGGTNRDGTESVLETSSIIVIDGAPSHRHHRDPALTNSALFQRDRYLCAYCGGIFRSMELTRDHIHPTSKGGRDIWMNVVAACKNCNAMKGDTPPGVKLPHGIVGPQGNYKMDPLFVPYIPCKAEHMLLKNRSIKFDQMMFLLARVKNKKSRIFDYAHDLFPDREISVEVL